MPESNETNNTYSRTFTVVPAPLPPTIIPPPRFPLVEVGTGRKAKNFQVIQLQFNEAVIGAGNPAAYHLYLGKTKKGVTTFTTPVRLTTVLYNPTTDTVELFPKGKLNLAVVERLRVTAFLIADSSGLALDGNYDGQPGGDFVATFRKRVVTSTRSQGADGLHRGCPGRDELAGKTAASGLEFELWTIRETVRKTKGSSTSVRHEKWQPDGGFAFP